MFDYISGQIIEINPDQLVIDVNGVGYRLAMMKHEYHLHEIKKIYVYHHLAENLHELYGFSSLEQRLMFKRLISIRGIGVKLAHKILTQFALTELEVIYLTKNITALSAIKGISKTLATTIINELYPANPKINEIYQILVPLNVDISEINTYLSTHDWQALDVEVVVNEIIQNKTVFDVNPVS